MTKVIHTTGFITLGTKKTAIVIIPGKSVGIRSTILKIIVHFLKKIYIFWKRKKNILKFLKKSEISYSRLFFTNN